MTREQAFFTAMERRGYVSPEPKGKGAYGTVYRFAGADGAAVAGKLFEIDFIDDEVGVAAVLREVAVGLKCNSRHVVRYNQLIVEAGAAAGRGARTGLGAEPLCYVIREWARGEVATYENLLKVKARPLEEVILSLAAGLRDIHDAVGGAHRDVKPENVVVDPATGDGKWLDLGLARLAGRKDSEGGTPVGVGMVLSAPPEACPDAQTVNYDLWEKPGDWYAFAATAFYWVTGRWPGATPGGGRIDPDRLYAWERSTRIGPELKRRIEKNLSPSPRDRLSMDRFLEPL